MNYTHIEYTVFFLFPRYSQLKKYLTLDSAKNSVRSSLHGAPQLLLPLTYSPIKIGCAVPEIYKLELIQTER